MKKEEIYFDLSKVSEEKQEEIISWLPEPYRNTHYDVCGNYKYLIFGNDYWFVHKYNFSKTEINEQQLKELLK